MASDLKFNILIRIGFRAADLFNEVKDLIENCHKMYSFYKIANRWDVYTDKIKAQSLKKRVLEFIRYKISKINRLIASYNKDVIKVASELKIKKIMFSDIAKGFSMFFKTDETKISKPHEKLLINSFDLYISNKMKPMMENLSYSKSILDYKIKSFELYKIRTKYHKSLYEVIDLYFLGYKTTALLVLGRLFEEIVTRYLLRLQTDRKINTMKKSVLKMRFEDKLGLLKSNNFISEKDWLIISKVKFDRNIGGHFSPKRGLQKEAELESEATIKLALKLINKFDKKLDAQKTYAD